MLSDVKKRSAYDRQRRYGTVQDLLGGFVDDVLGGKRRRRRDGRDVRFTLKLTLEEATLGVSRPIHFEVPEVCTACDGTGAAPGGSRPCPACQGRGEIKERPGLLSLPTACARCGGQGIAILTACKACGSLGTIDRTREFLVKLPPGVRSGDVKIIDGQGEPGRFGGRPGDLHVIVELEPDPLLRIDGADLHLDLPVRFLTAALGGVVEVPTIEGQVKMKIPAGSQSGRVFRLRSRGLARGPGRGDQLVHLVVETPVSLGAAQEQALEHFDRTLEPAMHPRMQEYQERLARRIAKDAQ